MTSPYDNFDYPSYWVGREYEHESEIIAIKSLLNKIPEIKKLAEIGCGYGRLTPSYSYRAKKSVLFDPSNRSLNEAKKRIFENEINGNFEFVRSRLDSISKKYDRSFDVVLFIRVMHHMDEPNKVFKTLRRILTPGGYLIMEFANKIHWKALIGNFFKGNFTFPIDIFPTDKSTKKRKEALPFLNYHPDVMLEEIKRHHFKILEVRSVSNIRDPFIKRHVPLSTLLNIENFLQKPLAKIFFGPSIFVIAKKIV